MPWSSPSRRASSRHCSRRTHSRVKSSRRTAICTPSRSSSGWPNWTVHGEPPRMRTRTADQLGASEGLVRGEAVSQNRQDRGGGDLHSHCRRRTPSAPMDQDTMVSEQTKRGKRLIEALVANGFDVRVAFWAKPTDEGTWFLYLASPLVDDKGPAAAYRIVHDILRKMPDPWIDPFEIRVVGLNDSLTEAALAATKPKVPDSPFAVRNPKPYPDDLVRWVLTWWS